MAIRHDEELSTKTIGEMIGAGRVQVAIWRKRYAAGGLAALEHDLPRGGRKRTVDSAEIVRLTTQTKPEAATQWSTRTLAATYSRSDWLFTVAARLRWPVRVKR